MKRYSAALAMEVLAGGIRAINERWSGVVE